MELPATIGIVDVMRGGVPCVWRPGQLRIGPRNSKPRGPDDPISIVSVPAGVVPIPPVGTPGVDRTTLQPVAAITVHVGVSDDEGKPPMMMKSAQGEVPRASERVNVGKVR